MEFSRILYEAHAGVARIILNRPERTNALDQPMLEEINTAMDLAEADDDIRVVIVQGAGHAFSSGFDLKAQMDTRPSGVQAWRPLLRKDFDTVMRFWHCPKPTLAVVRGPCLAGACELALACDMTIASHDAFFGEPELKFGASIVVMLLPWIVGPKLAREIILLGMDRIPAQRAAEIGMINRVVSGDALEGEVERIAQHMAAIDPELLKHTKRAINQSFEAQGLLPSLERALDIALTIEGEGSPDKAAFFDIARSEGLRAAITWRDARFPESMS